MTTINEQDLRVVIEARCSVPGENRDEAFERLKFLLTTSDRVQISAQDITIDLKVREVDIV